MRTAFVGLALMLLLAGGMAGGWVALNYASPGSLGTPAHAGAVSNGHPEQCTLVDLSVRARSQAEHRVLLEPGWILRGTFSVEGGFGRVDVFLRIVDPQGLDVLASPRADHYDFVVPVKVRGEYRLVFDNRFSLYTSKSVGMYYCIDRGGAPAQSRPMPRDAAI